MNFENLELNPKILKALNFAGYKEATKIQAEAIPHIMSGSDVRASAHTGTGKTAAFLLPALHRLATPAVESGKGPRILILVPTRELGTQIETQARKYSKFLPKVRTLSISGGVPFATHMKKMNRPYDILIATPGRLLDYIGRGKIDFKRLEMVVLDEADRMLDMGFMEPVASILSATPESRQTLLFSATLEGSVKKLSDKHMKDPVEIVIHTKTCKQQNIDQQLHFVDGLHHKNRLLNHILGQDEVTASIIFTSTKHHADQLAQELQDNGYLAEALHGDMRQCQRNRTLQKLRDGRFSILVATDVAARGIDIPTISHVINFDLPQCTEDYIHRIGRTGRAGAQGTALTFATHKDIHQIKQIEKFTGHPLNPTVIPGFEPTEKKHSKPNGKPRPRPFAKKQNSQWQKKRPYKKHARKR